MCNCTSENLETPGLVLTDHPGMTGSINRIAPAPTAGSGIVCLGPARHFCEDETCRSAEFGRYFDLGDDRLRQYPGRTLNERRARQRDIGEFFVFERQLLALALLVPAGALQALGEMAPAGSLK